MELLTINKLVCSRGAADNVHISENSQHYLGKIY